MVFWESTSTVRKRSAAAAAAVGAAAAALVAHEAAPRTGVHVYIYIALLAASAQRTHGSCSSAQA